MECRSEEITSIVIFCYRKRTRNIVSGVNLIPALSVPPIHDEQDVR